MERSTIRIGISQEIDEPGEAFQALNLHLYAATEGRDERDPRNVWWSTPVRWLGDAGVVRLGGAAVVWGPLDELDALVKEQPDPVCVVVPWPPEAQPEAGLLAADHVLWIYFDAIPAMRVEIDCLPERAAEIRIYDSAKGE